MGFRGIARDMLSFYLGMEIIYGYVTGDMNMLRISITGMVLFLLAVWFILERLGILPRMG